MIAAHALIMESAFSHGPTAPGIFSTIPGLFYRGDFLSGTLIKARVTGNEARAAVRNAGVARLESVGAVIMETDGSFSVIREVPGPESTILDEVKGPDLPQP